MRLINSKVKCEKRVVENTQHPHTLHGTIKATTDYTTPLNALALLVFDPSLLRLHIRKKNECLGSIEGYLLWLTSLPGKGTHWVHKEFLCNHACTMLTRKILFFCFSKFYFIVDHMALLLGCCHHTSNPYTCTHISYKWKYRWRIKFGGLTVEAWTAK